MNWKRTILLTLVLSMVGTAAVLADDIYETIKAKKITVSVNGESLGGQSYEVKGKQLVPLDKIADSLHAIVQRDGDQVNIYKPNVHMSLLSVTKKGLALLGAVNKEDRYVFLIQSQGDNVAVDVENLKFEIVDPSDRIVYEEIVPAGDGVKGSFISYTSEITLKFEHAGNYTVKAYMQLKKNGDYYLVSEKVIQSLAK